MASSVSCAPTYPPRGLPPAARRLRVGCRAAAGPVNQHPRARDFLSALFDGDARLTASGASVHLGSARDSVVVCGATSSRRRRGAERSVRRRHALARRDDGVFVARHRQPAFFASCAPTTPTSAGRRVDGVATELLAEGWCCLVKLTSRGRPCADTLAPRANVRGAGGRYWTAGAAERAHVAEPAARYRRARLARGAGYAEAAWTERLARVVVRQVPLGASAADAINDNRRGRSDPARAAPSATCCTSTSGSARQRAAASTPRRHARRLRGVLRCLCPPQMPPTMGCSAASKSSPTGARSWTAAAGSGRGGNVGIASGWSTWRCRAGAGAARHPGRVRRHVTTVARRRRVRSTGPCRAGPAQRPSARAAQRADA